MRNRDRFGLVIVVALLIGCFQLRLDSTKTSAMTPAQADAACASAATGNSGASGFGIFTSALEIGPDEIGEITFRTYVCNGTDRILDRDFSMLSGDGFVQETGLSGAFDYSLTGWSWNSSESFWMQDMGSFAPHEWRSKDVTIRVDGSKFNDSGWYKVNIQGKGRLWDKTLGCNYPGFWFPPGCAGDTNVITITLNLRIVRPSISCKQIEFSPDNPSIADNFITKFNFEVSNGVVKTSTYPMSVKITLPSGAELNYPNVAYTPSPANRTVFSYTAPSISDISGGTYVFEATVKGPDWFTPVSCSKSIVIADRPYLQIYQGDVIAGGKFEEDGENFCDSSVPGGAGGIRTFSRSTATRQIGSYVQYGAFAKSDIEDDVSAIDLTGFTSRGPTSGSDSFTFSNTTNPEGQFGVDNCMKNYYQVFDDGSSPVSGDFDLSSISGKVTVKKNGPVRVYRSGNSSISGKGAVLLVDGDVTIDSDIDFRSGSGTLATDIDSIPYLIVVAKGDIFISPSVSKMDGVYVAQPDLPSNPNSGSIVTCHDSTPADDNDLYNTCKNQLRVTGSLIARKIEWKRTWGDLNDLAGSQNDRVENNYYIGNASESINISPEVYFGLPTSPRSYTKYDSLRSLPPVF